MAHSIPTSHLARAVVPPPRLRAKCVVFSALLQVLRRGPGWACSGGVGRGKACESLRGWAVLQKVTGAQPGTILRGGSGKGLVFRNGGRGDLQAPYLLGLKANFEGLVMVRFEVRKSQAIDL